MRPRNYGHLQGLAGRYAQARLDGRAVVNRATGRPILFDWSRGLREAVAPGTPPELAARYAQAKLDGRAVVNRVTQRPILFDWRRGLREAVAPGTAPELLLLLPALPALLAEAGYLDTDEDRRHRSDVRQVHGFGATADVIGRPIELWLLVGEDSRGRLVFERALSRDPLIAPSEDGGVLPDGPGARSQALHAVLSRAYIPPRRQDGGETNGADEDGAQPTNSRQPSDASAEQIALGPVPMPGSGATDMLPNIRPVLGGDKCDEQFHDDLQICRSLPNETKEEKDIRQMCWGNAQKRYAACIGGVRGEDLPPLDTWSERAASPPSWKMPSLPPMILPRPPGQGGGGLARPGWRLFPYY